VDDRQLEKFLEGVEVSVTMKERVLSPLNLLRHDVVADALQYFAKTECGA
jgi:hypothetical protein